MKKLMILCFLQTIVIAAYAQTEEVSNAFYGTVDFDFGNYMGFNMNVNLIVREKHSFQFGFSDHLREAKSIPQNYNPGLDVFNFIWVHDKMKNLQLLSGCIIKIGTEDKVRLNMLGGFGYTTIFEPKNWRYDSNNFFGSNYTYNIERSNAISLIFNPRLEIIRNKVIGGTISPVLQINKKSAYVGIGLGLMIGKLD